MKRWQLSLFINLLLVLLTQQITTNAINVSLSSQPSNDPYFSITHSIEKFILKVNNFSEVVITSDTQNALVLVHKSISRFQSVESMEGLLDLSDLALLNHNMQKLAKQFLSNQTSYRKSRYSRSPQPHNFYVKTYDKIVSYP